MTGSRHDSRSGRTRLARGSVPPQNVDDWLAVAVRARFPKLALLLGDKLFHTMLAGFAAHDEEACRSLDAASVRLPQYLASKRLPLWCAELAVLERVHVTVAQAPATSLLTRGELTVDCELRLVPAHSLVLLMTNVDELWSVLDYVLNTGDRIGPPPPRLLARSRTLSIWRKDRNDIRSRSVNRDEAAALRAAAYGTTLRDLGALLGDHACALDYVTRWLDAGMLVQPAVLDRDDRRRGQRSGDATTTQRGVVVAQARPQGASWSR